MMHKVIVGTAVVACFTTLSVMGILLIPRTVHESEPSPEVVVEIDDGGPALPFVYHWNIVENQASPGLSLRDHFATEAMRSMVRNWPVVVTEGVLAETSRLAYDLGDRMIDQRSK